MAGKKIQITLPEQLSDALEKISQEKGLTKSVLLALALEDFLKKQKEGGQQSE